MIYTAFCTVFRRNKNSAGIFHRGRSFCNSPEVRRKKLVENNEGDGGGGVYSSTHARNDARNISDFEKSCCEKMGFFSIFFFLISKYNFLHNCKFLQN